ncbi:MAG: hypothetical protein HY540_06280 [Deltaproteobacteria bacterium]|nr:hypothetical protein [Deltaproteobacteria bacterium]
MKILFSSVIAFTLFACASSSKELLEQARFALDNSDFSTAVTEAKSVLDANTTDLEAALVLSSAYAGRGGIDILSIADDLATTDKADDLFDAIHDALASNITETTGLDDLREAIVTLDTTLTQAPDATHPLYKEYQFQLGLLEAIEALSLPSLKAQPTADGTVTVSDIAQADYAIVQTDFSRADNHLINGDLKTDNALVTAIRKNFCVLKASATGASPSAPGFSGNLATTGFSLVSLRDLNNCELQTDRSSITTFETSGIATCTDFNFSVCSAAGNTTDNL